MEPKLVTRLFSGTILGAWVGFVYGIMAANINILIIRDLPLRYELPDALTTTGWALAIGALMGFLINIPHDALKGVVLGSLSAAVGIAANGLMDAGDSPDRVISTLFVMGYVFLPLAVLFVPFNALLRWSSHQVLPYKNSPEWSSWPRLRSALLWTFMAGLVGSFSLYPDTARQMMYRMVDLVQMTQNRSETIPFEFVKYQNAIQSASPNFTIEWSDDLRAYPEPLFTEDARTNMRLQVVTVHFASGQSLYCLFREIDKNVYLCTMRDRRPYTDFKAMSYRGVAWYSHQINETVNNLLASPAEQQP